ncbi:PssD/Cps14F family polysaccharide biosynthesis glycosyltransferase [Dubosiella newyorkensis]|uniref:Polysaccharide biosynthesis protein n=1 Tax=Dubosiella newyorkensis TaxID=1862672 RepID=A0A1U7NKJ8_9FIRM|nr:PssD/Cps14F family polysaccharide biosynthesis glycosyltransferase [Dubosiella newyorkensis]OLU44775.1 polysaccharide biosynthesis protein [Dubosiella newyorkensis]
MNRNQEIKVCFAASSGGHFEQLSMLKPLMDKYDSFVVAEKTTYKASIKDEKMYFLHQVNRKEWSMPIWMVINTFKSLKIVVDERPEVIITTGVLAMIPLCLLVKILGGKLIYIESFAKVSSPTKTGKLLYRFADQFYVQWESMKIFYPDAIYLGGIY